MQVKIVSDVFCLYLGKKLMTLEVTEPLDPAVARFTVIVVVQVLVYISRNCRVRLGTHLNEGALNDVKGTNAPL